MFPQRKGFNVYVFVNVWVRVFMRRWTKRLGKEGSAGPCGGGCYWPRKRSREGWRGVVSRCSPGLGVYIYRYVLMGATHTHAHLLFTRVNPWTWPFLRSNQRTNSRNSTFHSVKHHDLEIEVFEKNFPLSDHIINTFSNNLNKWIYHINWSIYLVFIVIRLRV